MTKVLFVDDEVATMLAETLSGNGLECFSAKNGQEGLEQLTQNPDIVFLDFQMKGMNGYEFSKAVKTGPQYQQYSNIPLIGIGSFPNDRFKQYLADSIDKPLNKKQIVDCIEKYVPQ